MSLYNMLFGVNDAAPVLMQILKLTPAECGRFRDAYIEGDHIVIHTRNGGGNREDYQDVLDELAKHPNWLYDQDDEFDCTYANIHFSFPEPYAEQLRALAEANPTVPPAEKWQMLLAALETNRNGHGQA